MTHSCLTRPYVANVPLVRRFALPVSESRRPPGNILLDIIRWSSWLHGVGGRRAFGSVGSAPLPPGGGHRSESGTPHDNRGGRPGGRPLRRGGPPPRGGGGGPPPPVAS